MRARSVLLLSCFFSVCLLAQVPGQKGDRMLLPNGWWLTPAGEQIPLGDFPTNAALSADGSRLAILHSGQSKAQVMLVDLKTRNVVQTIGVKDAWQGIAFEGNTLYVSGGYQNCVYTFQMEKGMLTRPDSIVLIDPATKKPGTAEGLDVFGSKLAVVFRADSTLRYYDLKAKKQTIVHLDGMPYSCTFDANGLLLVSIWSSRKVQVFDKETMVYQCTTGDHPNEITIPRNSRYAYIACSNDNTVSIIDLRQKKAIASVGTAIHPDAPEGSTTNSVCVSNDGKMILAANADNNSLTVVDVRNPMQPRPVGFIPVGWYPTKVMMLKDNTVLVLNGKGSRSFANPKGQYIGSLMEGSLSVFPYPDVKTLATYSQQVFQNTPYKQEALLKTSFMGESAIPKAVGEQSPIKHILYIIRENRTYDQVLGDVAEGNGDTSLCLFNEKVTPNAHKLVKDFVLLDNFYVNSEVSADGHNWSMAGYATDYVEKTWPTQYGGRGGEYDFEGTEPTGRPKSGYLWSAAKRANVSYRVYGEFIDPATPDGKPPTPRDPAIGKNFSTTYRGWDLDYSDVDRYKAWEKELTEFEKSGALPSLCIMHLPNDHTSGTHRGALTPKAYVAQNDYALGLIIDRLSKSPYWKEMAVFVVEDDAQNGPDHVDAHRSVGLVISPFTRGKGVDHTLFTTASMLRSIELILGISPMSQYDASATPMFSIFAPKPDLAPFTVEQPRQSLTEKNKTGSYGQLRMDRFNLRREDAVPDREFNEIIWRSIKGTPMPAPRYSIFSRAPVGRDDD